MTNETGNHARPETDGPNAGGSLRTGAKSWRVHVEGMLRNIWQLITRNKVLTSVVALVIILLIIITILVWPSSPGLLDDPVIVGTGTDEPQVAYQDPQTNRRSGFDVDFYRWIANQSDPRFVPSENDVNIGNREQALRTGQVKLVFDSYSITTLRERQIDFAGPYLYTQQGLMLRTGDLSTFKGLSDLAGQKVCAQSGATSISGIDGIPGAVGVPRETLIECVNGLKSGEFKAVSTDQLLLTGWKIKFPNEPVSVVGGVTFGALQEWGIGLPPGPGKGNCEEMNQWIRTFLDSGQWDVFFQKNFPGVDPSSYKPESKNLRECRDDTDE